MRRYYFMLDPLKRYHFTPELAAEHILGSNSWHWVHPITGEHCGYVVPQEIVYASTIEAQRAEQRA